VSACNAKLIGQLIESKAWKDIQRAIYTCKDHTITKHLQPYAPKRQEEIVAHIKAYNYARTVAKRWRDITTHHIDPSNVKHLAIVITTARLLIRVYRDLRDLLGIEVATWYSTNLEQAYWQANPSLYIRHLQTEEAQLHKKLRTIAALHDKRTLPTTRDPTSTK